MNFYLYDTLANEVDPIVVVFGKGVGDISPHSDNIPDYLTCLIVKYEACIVGQPGKCRTADSSQKATINSATQLKLFVEIEIELKFFVCLPGLLRIITSLSVVSLSGLFHFNPFRTGLVKLQARQSRFPVGLPKCYITLCNTRNT